MKKYAPLLVILAGCLWGSMGLFVRTFNAIGLESMQISAIRAACSAILLLLVLPFYDKTLLRIRLRDLWCFLGSGICSMTMFNYCYFRTIELTSLSVAAIMLYTAPIFVMLLSAKLFGEKITRRKLVALALAFTGCLLVSGVLAGGTARLSPLSLLLGLGSGFGYALYSIFSRFALNRGYHSLTITLYTFIFAGISSLLLAERAPILNLLAAGQPLQIIFMIFFAIVTSVAPYLSYTLGLVHVENAKASVIASIEPVMATLFGFFFFQELPTISGFVGMLLVLSAVFLLSRPEKQKEILLPQKR